MSAAGNMVVSILLRAVDNVTGPVRRVRQGLGSLRRQATTISRRVGFDRLGSSLQRVDASGRELYRTAQRLTRRLVLLGSLGVGAIAGITFSTAAGADELAKWSDDMGLAISQTQSWQYAAERMGVTQQQFNSAVESFVRRLGDARNGQGELYSRLRDTHPQLLQQLLLTRDTNEALQIMMRGLHGTGDAMERNQMAAAAFNRGGSVMTRMVRDGTDELERLRQRAFELGFMLSDGAARSAEEFADRLLDARKSMQGIRNVIGVELIPVFSELLGQFSELIVRYQPQVQAWAANFAAGLPDRLTQLRADFFQLLETLQPLINAGAMLVERFGAVNVAAAVLGAFLFGPMVVATIKFTLALGSLTIALARVAWGLGWLTVKAIPIAIGAAKAMALGIYYLGWTMTWLAARALPVVIAGLRALAVAAMANPVTAIITGIALGAALLIANWDSISEWWGNLWADIKYGAGEAWDWLKGLWGRAGDWFASIDWAAHGRALIETLVRGMMSVATSPARAIAGIASRVREYLPFSDARRGPLSQLTASGRALPETLAEGVDDGRGNLVDAVQRAARNASNVITMPQSGSGTGRRLAAAGGGGAVVHRVDFRPSITIHAGDNATPRDIADLVDERLRRYQQGDLWGVIQDSAGGES